MDLQDLIENVFAANTQTYHEAETIYLRLQIL